VKNQDNTKQGSLITVDSDGFVNLARPKQSLGPKTFEEEKKDEEEKLQGIDNLTSRGSNLNQGVDLVGSKNSNSGNSSNIKTESKESQLYNSA